MALHRGAFGECHAAIDKATELRVAVKSVFKSNKRFKQNLLNKEISVRFSSLFSLTLLSIIAGARV